MADQKPDPELWKYDEDVDTEAKRIVCQENRMQDSPCLQTLATRRLFLERAALRGVKEAAEAKAAAAKQALQDEAEIIAKISGLDLLSTSSPLSVDQINAARTLDAPQDGERKAAPEGHVNNSVDPSPSRYGSPTVEASQEDDDQRNEDTLPFYDNRPAITQEYPQAYPVFGDPRTRDFAFPSNQSRNGRSSNVAPHVKAVIKSFQATIKNAGITKRSTARERKATFNTSRYRQLHAGRPSAPVFDFGVFSDHAKTKESEEGAEGVIHEDADDEMMDIKDENAYSDYFGGNLPFSKG